MPERACSSSAQTATAIAPGALSTMPATPIGHTISTSRAGSTPRAASRRSNFTRLVREPIIPKYA